MLNVAKFGTLYLENYLVDRSQIEERSSIVFLLIFLKFSINSLYFAIWFTTTLKIHICRAEELDLLHVTFQIVL